jgi:beta-glucosidase
MPVAAGALRTFVETAIDSIPLPHCPEEAKDFSGAKFMRCFVRLSLRVLSSAIILYATAFAQNIPAPADAPYKNAGLPLEKRVADLLSRMTLEEKVTMLSGSGWMESAPIARLGIPAIKMADGPMGVRSWAGSSAVTNATNNPVKVQTTSFPAGIAMASTWDPDLVQREGKAIGQEVKALGRDMILGPTVNINRVPLWGRNFEGYGEDPYLAAQLGVAYIRGVQGEGVIPSVKHFAANNEEFERHRIDAKIDERTLHEIYLPAFKAAVQQADVWTVMSAYNKVNGVHCAENAYLLTDVLKKEFGFKGLVISDWGSTYSTTPTVNAGMDLEMPGGPPMKAWLGRPATQAAGNDDGWLVPEKILQEVKAGRITQATVDDNVGRILRVIFLSGLFEFPHTALGEVDTQEQQALAREAATKGIVLLKNAGELLPLDPAKVKSIAVIGPNALLARTGGGGSSLVKPKYAVTPLEGIQKRAGSEIKVTSALGVGMDGEDPAQDTPEARERSMQEAVGIASKADVAVVVVGRYFKNEGEGFDVKTMDLPAGQDELIAAVEKANPRTVVVLNTGDPVTMSKWIDATPSLLDMWYGGQEGGNALASVLFGDANPSGKLPVSLPKKFEDSPAAKNYPGQDLVVRYAEGIYVGYRYYDTKKVAPLFPFGFGLSYTTFEYTNLHVKPIKAAAEHPIEVTLQVKNTGNRAGAEVVELYVHDGHSKIDRPVHELKAFGRVELKPGESKSIEMKLDQSAFTYWSPESKTWVAEPGAFEIQVGASSRDIRLRAPFELTR